MFKSMLIGTATALTLMSAACEASAHGRGGGFGNFVAGAIAGAVGEAIVNQNGEQYVCQLRTAYTPYGARLVRVCGYVFYGTPAPVDQTPSPSPTDAITACQAAMNTGDSDKVSRYCN